jgi:ABC-type transport system substrate-binding protein
LISSDGELAVKFVLTSPYARFADYVQLGIVPASAVKGSDSERKDYDLHPVGTGPFKLSSWTKDQIVLDANMQHFAGRPHLDRVIFRYFPNQKAAWTGLMQGDVDLVLDVDTDDSNVIKADPRFKVYEYLDTFCYMLVFNLKDPVFADKRMRQAVSYAPFRAAGCPQPGPFSRARGHITQTPGSNLSTLQRRALC